MKPSIPNQLEKVSDVKTDTLVILSLYQTQKP